MKYLIFGKFEGTYLVLLEPQTQICHHLHLSHTLVSADPPDARLPFKKIGIKLYTWSVEWGGRVYEWKTIKAEDRCSCGFMPYTEPVLVYDASEEFPEC